MHATFKQSFIFSRKRFNSCIKGTNPNNTQTYVDWCWTDWNKSEAKHEPLSTVHSSPDLSSGWEKNKLQTLYSFRIPGMTVTLPQVSTIIPVYKCKIIKAQSFAIWWLSALMPNNDFLTLIGSDLMATASNIRLNISEGFLIFLGYLKIW